MSAAESYDAACDQADAALADAARAVIDRPDRDTHGQLCRAIRRRASLRDIDDDAWDTLAAAGFPDLFEVTA